MRAHAVPTAIQQANADAHAAISSYVQQNGVTGSPWDYYKLVNVQWKPLDKPAGAKTYSNDEEENSSYFLSNMVVETNYNLQFFSGLLVAPSPSNGQLTSDYNPKDVGGWPSLPLTTAQQSEPFKNTYYLKDDSGTSVSAYNMGGCMGCHGNAQFAGDDFSFILNVGRNAEPDTALPTTPSKAALKAFKAIQKKKYPAAHFHLSTR